MGDGLILQIVTGLLVVFSCVLIWLCWKSWRWLHTFSLFFVLGASIAACSYLALVLKVRSSWQIEYFRLEKLLAEEKKREALLLSGGVDPAQAGEEVPSLMTLQETLTRLNLDRGRVWRECQLVNYDAASQTADLATTPPAAPGGAAPPPNNIAADMLLYAFKEVPSADGVFKVPVEYLGEFRAASVAAGSVQLVPTAPLDPDQVRAINLRDSTWVLYELMPLDAHEVYHEADPGTSRPVSLAGDEPMFGELLDRTRMAGLFPRTRFPTLDDAEYEALLTSYLYDGYAVTAVQVDLPAFDPPLEEQWVKVKFLAEGGHTVEVDAAAPGPPLDTAFFDQFGRAMSPALMQGGPTKFAKGDFGVFDETTAAQLVADGVAEKQAVIFVRDLRDYDFFFRDARHRLGLMQQKTAALRTDTAKLSDALDDARAAALAAQDENMKLLYDLAGYRDERDRVAGYRQILVSENQALLAELSRLYRGNLQLAAELAALQKTLTDEINRRTTAAAASPDEA